MPAAKPLNPEDTVYRYTGDPATQFFYGVPARDLTAGEWDGIEPTRKADVRAATFYAEVGTRADRLAEVGLPDIIQGDDPAPVLLEADDDTGGIVPASAGPVPGKDE